MGRKFHFSPGYWVSECILNFYIQNKNVTEMAELCHLSSNQKNWYAVYTRPRWEKKVNELLVKKQLECFCPLQRVQKKWSDRKKIIEEPIFRSYVFVHITDKEFCRVLSTEGILNFVYYNGKPAQIKSAEIDLIKSYLEMKDVIISCKPLPVFEQNDQVKIAHGLFMDNTGTVKKTLKNRVVVELTSLQQAMIIEFSASYLEKVAIAK